MPKIDIEKINKKLTPQNIKLILQSFGAYHVSENEEQIVFPSICHHKDFLNHKKKLYYYKNGSFFLCFSCSNSFDVYSLVKQRKELLGETYNFPQCIKYVCDIIGITCDNVDMPEKKENIYDWSGLKKYLPNYKAVSTLKEYDKSVLKYLEDTYHESFIEDNISIETMVKFNVKFYPYKQQICLPIYDDEANFVGVHCRNLLPELVDSGYKYMPLSLLDGIEYKFNTSQVLYGLNMNKTVIKNSKTAIIVEAPKGVQQLNSYGIYNGVGLFGRILQKEKLKLLLKYEVENIVIALDKQYHKMYQENGNKTDEFIKYEKVVMKIVDDLKPYMKNIYVMYDRDEDNFLNYCDSPMDKGKKVWDKMWENKEKVV